LCGGLLRAWWRSLGVGLMTIGMLVAGIACLLAGLLAIGFGIPINEFGLGNTLILAGAVTGCTGLIILSLWVVVKELKNMAGQLGAGPSLEKGNARQPVALPENLAGAEPGAAMAGGPSPAPSAPWLEEAAGRDRPRQEAPSPPEPPAAKSRRNLMFSSSARRERERAQGRDPSVAELRPEVAAPPMEISEPPPATFEDAWPKSERARPTDAPLPRRGPRAPSTFSETAAATRQVPVVEGQPPVTVLKSGVVDGMAYSLYSDGSIEAQMPEGMMRFASIDELRAHLDQRP
jgi:hypothetical protein